ncbi:alpha-ketoglutarate-dependent dioxygenase AlkB [Asticcacaulis sp. 201]|uniref:alpha-ketoglutarate-dependent dioxygenase AlkB n=1 Tax=Asticcacaulis sp. 201 TaxID=3028787 RepID=UPI002916F6CA|nr:alpha-ketoglutarate-dependent dioxygenase AlkB [Asticcacaulis sp. 201]MDV6333139.1 alpha-ketoglutarate-dependent dioxygenase AlkB [Asticcacaulis sp. 201]
MAAQSPLSLFEEAPLPGLAYRDGYISAEEEAALIAHIDRQPWSMELLRRRQWYGWAPDDTAYGSPQEYRPQPMPNWMRWLAERLHRDAIFAGVPERALINEYHPGQGIGAHKDRDVDRIRSVAIVSLGAPIMMEFTRLGHDARTQYLYPRSLLIMSGEARDKWMHGIVGRKSDRVGGLIMVRQRRISVTFRFVAPRAK